jgi:hypothetical protein
LFKRLENGGYPLPLDVVSLHLVDASTSPLARTARQAATTFRPEHAVVERMESAMPAPLGRLVSLALEWS